MTATLKKTLGDAGAFLADDHGDDNLHAVLKAMAEEGAALNAYQATVATAIIGGHVVDKPSKLRNFRIDVGTTGTAGSTVVEVNVNGTQKGELTVDNADADGTGKSVDLDVDLVAGDVVTIEVTTAPTAGANLVATARMRPVTVAA